MLKAQNRMSGRLGNLEGFELERRLHRIVLGYLFTMYRLRRPQILMSVSVFSPHAENFIDKLSEANFAGKITEQEYRRVTDTDLIMKARRREDSAIVYYAVEASSVIDSRDVSRAIDTAKTLQYIYGDEATPIFLGYEIADDAQRMANDYSAGVIIINRPSPPL